MKNKDVINISHIDAIGPFEEFSKNANLTLDDYKKFTKWAEDDFEGFWDYFAKKEISWFKPYDKVFDDSNAPFFKFFSGGKLNMAYNCVDRHINTWRKNKAAILWENERGDNKILTYRELYFQVSKFANVLKTLGVGKGDIVIIYMPMIVELPIAMLACAKIGAIHSVVFAGLSAKALSDRIMDANAKVIVTANGGYRAGKTIQLKDNVDEALKDTKGVKYVIVNKHIDQEVPMKTLRDFWWSDLMSDEDYAKPFCEVEEMDSEDPLFLLYTSGSTGKPKGVVHTTAGYLMWRILASKWVFDIKDTDTVWSTANIGWISGHSYNIYGPLSIGATTFIYEGMPLYPDPGHWWSLIERYNVNIFYTAPTAIRALMKHGEKWTKKYDLSSLRLLLTGGERLNSAAWMWFYKNVGNKKCPVIDAYGQTETAGHMIAALPIFKQKPGSIGVSMPGVFPAVLDAKGNEIKKSNVTGCLAFTKAWPSMVRTLWNFDEGYVNSYWKKYNNEAYATGDLARRDEDGYYWMEGRNDDMINVAAHRIGSAEVESALSLYPDVSEAAVVGKSSEVKGEEIFAFVVLKDGVDLTDYDELVRDLRDFVGKQIGPIAKPSEIVFTQALPKTRSGKILRRILRDIVAGKNISGDLSTMENPIVIEEIKKLLKERTI